MSASRSAPRRPLRAGTTVIELVVALVITGVVAAAGAAAFRQAIDRRTQLLTSATATERAAARRAQLRAWLSAGTLVWPPDDAGALAFITTAATPVGAPGTVLRLYVDDDVATPERGLTLAFRGAASGPMVRREIDPAVAAMTVEYLDAATGRWTSGEGASPARPTAVRLRFTDAMTAGADGGEAAHDRLAALPLTVVMANEPGAASTSPSGARP